MSMARQVTVALDWTPNGNHAGIIVALAKQWYAEEGLEVEIVSPHSNAYSLTPASLVSASKEEDCVVAITPTETVISHYLLPDGDSKKKDLVAVAALLQQDDSAIVTLRSSGIDRPQKLQGKRYGSYGARFEGRIIQQLIKNDGGSGEYQEVTPDKLGLWNTVVNGEMDATWVFMTYEGIEASMRGVDLNVFRLRDYGIDYGYPLVMVANKHAMENDNTRETVKRFLKQTARAYVWVQQNPELAAELFADQVKTLFPDLVVDRELVKASVRACAESFLDHQGQWGSMSCQKFDMFLDWLSANGLLTAKMQSRHPTGPNQTTLDGLRQGDVGELVARDSISSSDLFTDCLPI